jgi:hypothetical protein
MVIPSPAEDIARESKAGTIDRKREWRSNQKSKPSPAVSQETKAKAEKQKNRIGLLHEVSK